MSLARGSGKLFGRCRLNDGQLVANVGDAWFQQGQAGDDVAIALGSDGPF